MPLDLFSTQLLLARAFAMNQPKTLDTTEVEFVPAISSPLEAPVPFSSLVQIDFGAVSDAGKVRMSNQDAYLVFRTCRAWEPVLSNLPPDELPDRHEEVGYVMAVADGMGGAAAGDVASRLALRTAVHLILNAVKWALKLDHPEERDLELAESKERAMEYFRQIDAVLTRRAEADPSLTGMGTTLTAAYSFGDDLLISHVGDSRAYLFRHGLLKRLTRDHTVAQALADSGAILPEEVAGHRLHHVLTRAVGSHGGQVEADMHQCKLFDGDCVLLCTDGLTGTLTEEEIASVLGSAESSEAGCKGLVNKALERGGPDNVTVVLARYTLPTRSTPDRI
jgi:protein phosphatase